MSTYGVCKYCQYHLPKLSGQRAVSLYQEPLRGCIHRLKYDGNVRLAVPLGLLLAQACRRYGMQADMLIPVPLHSERQKQRGFNHAALFAEVCSAKVGVPMYDHILIRHRATIAQVGLHPSERYQNVAAPVHADVNGSYNIGRKVFPTAFDGPGIEATAVRPRRLAV